MIMIRIVIIYWCHSGRSSVEWQVNFYKDTVPNKAFREVCHAARHIVHAVLFSVPHADGNAAIAGSRVLRGTQGTQSSQEFSGVLGGTQTGTGSVGDIQTLSRGMSGRAI